MVEWRSSSFFQTKPNRFRLVIRTPANGLWKSGRGILKGCDVSNWKDEKAEYLKGKPSENPA